MSSLKHRARRWIALSTAAATAAAAMFDPAMMRSAAANTVYVYTGPGGTAVVSTTGDWNTATNWTGGIPANNINTQLNFGGSGASYTSLDDLSGSLNLNEILLSASGSAVNTIGSTAGDSLNFITNSNYNSPTLVQNGSGAFIIAPSITLANDLTINGTGLGSITLSGPISGSGGIIMSGAGTLFLNSGNSYTDPTTINSGIVSIAADSALGATSSQLILNGGTLATTANLTLNPSRSINVNNSSNINAASGTTLTFDGTINTNSNLNFGGLGTVDLGGQVNGYGTVTVSNGTLAVDFTQAGAPTSNILYSNANLSLNGGTVNFLVSATGNVSQSVSGVNIVAGQNNIGATIAAGGALALNLNYINRNNVGAVNFTIPTGDTIAIANGNNNGILGGWMTVGGTNWATTVNGDVVAYTGDTTVLPTSGASSSTNYILTSTGTTTLTAAESVNALRLNGSNGTLALGANALTFPTASSGGLLADTNYTISGTGQIGTGGGGEFIVTVASGATLTISAPLNTGDSTLTKAGPGTLTQSGAIGGTSTITVDAGTLNYNNNANAPAIGAINVAAGTLQVDSGNASVALTNPLGAGNTITLGSVGSATLGLWAGGNATASTYNNPIVIASGAGASGGSVTISDISGSQTLSGAVTFPTTGTNTLTLQNTNTGGGNLIFTGGVTGTGNLVLNVSGAPTAGTIQFTTTAPNNIGTIANNSSTTGTTGSITISSGLGANVTGLTQNSANVPLNLTGASASYVGSTFITLGTLNANIAGALGNSAITVNGGTLAESVANALNGASESLTIQSGTANLSQSNSFAGGTFVNGGTLNATAAGAVNALSMTGGTVNASIAGALSTVAMTGGVLSATNTSGAVNTGAISLNGGLLASGAVGGYGTVNGGTAVNTINPGNLGLYGQLNIVSLNTGSGSILQFDLSTPWSGTPANTGDLLDITGTNGLNIASGTSLSFYNGSPTASGDYRLIEYTGSINGLANLALPAPPRSGITYSLSTSVDPGYVDLVVNNGSAAINGSWLPTAAGTYSWTVPANWFNGNIPGSSGDSATFAGATGAEIVQLNGQQHLGSVTFNASTGGSYSFQQAQTTDNFSFDNGAGIATLLQQAGNNSITAPVSLLSDTNINLASGTTFTISGAIDGPGKLSVAAGTTSGGTLILSGSNTFTGGIEVDAGTLATPRTDNLALGNQGVGTVTLNGGTLSYTAGTTQITPPSGFVITIGANGGTLNTAGSGTTGKLLFNVNGELTGSGTLTKTGAAVWQMSNPNIGFSGNVNVNGLIEYQNIASLGGGGPTPGNSFVVGTGGELVNSGGIQMFQPITLAGGTLSADNSSAGIFNETVNVTAASTLAGREFYSTTVAENVAINTLTGSGNLNVIGGTGGLLGMITIENASGYTGTITLGTGGAIGIGNSNNGNFFGSSNTISASTTTSAIGLVSDGDGTSSPQPISYTLPSNAITFAAGNTGGYVVGKIGGTTYFNTEANKTILINGTLPLNNTNTLNVTPLNGYGLELDPVLTATTTYNVGGTQASNVVPGLILTNTSGAFGIIKTGTGTLQLGTSASDSSNTFGDGSGTLTDANSLIDIQGGTVSAFSDQNLGNPANIIKLDNTTAAEFLALGTFSTARTIDVAQATGSTIGVSGGNTLTLTTGLKYAAVGDTLTKVEDGTLVLTASAVGAPTSATALNAGAIKPISSATLGSGTITVANAIGAALQLDTTTLNNGTSTPTTFTQALSLSNSGIQGRGALENVSGANTWGTGTITIANAAVIGNDDTANTFTINSAITDTNGFATTGAGSITINGVISGAGAFTAGPGSAMNLTAAETVTGALQVFGGTMTFSGAGKNGGGGINIEYGGTLNYDDTTTNTTSRNNGHTNAFTDGTVNLKGNSGNTSTEVFYGYSAGRGEDVLDAIANGTGQANITLTSTGGAFTHNALSSAVFEGTNLNSTPAVGAGNGTITIGAVAATFQGAVQTGGLTNQAILPWALAENSSNGTYTFATSNSTTGIIRQLASNEANSSLVNTFGYAGSTLGTASTTNGSATVTVSNTGSLYLGEAVTGAGIAAGSYISAINSGTTFTLSANATVTASGVDLQYSSGADNVDLTTASSGPASALTQTINSLTLGSGGSLTLGIGVQTITLGGAQGGAILALDTVNGNTLSGGIITAGANELDIHTVGNLTISSAITGGGGGSNPGLTKGESGTLTLASTAFYAGQTVVNAGTLNLAAGNNTIQYANYMELGAGATLNLNGNSQVFLDLFNDSSVLSGLGTVGNNSTITGNSGATVTIKGDGTNSSRNYTGVITGGLNLIHSDTASSTWTLTQNETYTGATLINGGIVLLQNNGQLSNTSALTIDQAALTLDNNGGSMDLSTRLPTSLPITLGGGTITYIGRAQYTSAETLGAINTTLGANVLSVTQQTTGVSSATLTVSGLSRAFGSTVNFTNTNGTLGTIGSNPQILLLNNNTLTDNILGGGFVVNGSDWASYNSTFGVGGLSTTGYAGYSPDLITSAIASDNISMSTSPAANLNNTTINSLRVTGTSNITFNAGQGLTLTSGGLLLNASTTLGNAVNNGTLTSSGPELFLYVNSGTDVINSQITGSNALVKSGGTAVTLAGTNNYTGGTYVDQSTLTLAATGTLGTGGIFLNGGTLVQTAGGIIPSQAISITGAGVLTLAGANSMSSLTFNNNGGTTAPSITTTGGVLTLTGGAITASSSNVGTTAAISAGTIDLANAASPSITVNPITANGVNLAPLQPALNIAAVIQDANNPVTVSGGGVLQLSGQSTFTGGVNLTSGGIALGVTGTTSTGPLGTGTFTIGAGTSIIANGGSYTALNPVNVTGNFTFDDATATAYTTTLGGNNLALTLPSGGVTINVNAPQMTGALGGVMSGSATITKTGLGTLALTNNSLGYSGTVNVNSGTLLLTGPNAGTASPIGSGTAYLNGGVLQLHNNGGSSNSLIDNGANVTIDPSQTSAYIDINDNTGGTNTSNTFVMGYLTMQPTTLLNITGGNNYELRFTGTNLTSLNSPATFDVGTGLTLILPGGFTGTNLPTNIGPGILSYSGSNSTTGNTTITGIQQVTAAINTQNTPYGSGTVTLSNGSTLQLVPTNNPQATTASSAGYTQGGLLAKFNNYTGTGYAIISANESSLLPAAQMPGQAPGDASFDNRPPVVASAANYTDSSQAYNGLLNITTAGTYYFQVGADDADELVIDGLVVQNQLAASNGGQAMVSTTPVAVNLSAGAHTITWLAENLGGNGGQYLLYGGPDAAGSGQTTTGGNPVLQPIALSNLYYSSDIATAANNYLNAAQINNNFVAGAAGQSSPVSATLDGLGTDLNTVLGNLTLNSNGTTNSTTLVTNNLGGQGFIGVLGSTIISGTGATVNTNTGTLYLIGGVTDGGSGLTKTGTGTLMLGGSSGTFTGPLNITTGFLQLAASNALTTGTTTIASGATLDLNGITNVTGNISIAGTGFGKFSGTPAALYNSSYTTASLASSSTLTIASGSAVGGYGNIVDFGTINDGGNAWSKVGGDILTLSGNDTSITGALTVANGILQAGSAGGFGGSSGSITVASGAAVDLNGLAVSATRTLNINGTGVANTIYSNTLAALYNSSTSAAASYAGAVAMAGASSVGNNIYTPVTLSLSPQAGDIALNGIVSGAFLMTKTGSDSLFLTNGGNTFNDVFVPIGAVIFDGAGQQSIINSSNIINPGGTLVLDNTAQNVNNRLGNRGLWDGGSFTILGNSTASTTELINSTGNNVAIGNASGTSNATGVSVITLVPTSSESVTLTVNSSNTAMLNRAVAGSTLLVRGTNLGQNAPGTAGSANFTGSGTSVVNTNSGQIIGNSVTTATGIVNRAIIPWALVDTSATGNGISFAAFDATDGIQALQSGDTAPNWSAATVISSGTTNASANVTVTSTASLTVGTLVTGPNIPLGTYIKSITNGTTYVLSANATGTATSNLNYNVDPNASLTSSFTAPAGWTAINSLTLNNGSSLSIGAGNYLALDSGGVLAMGTASISGGGILTGTNNDNRELIFQTPNPDAGGTTTLTVSTPMYTVAGFTKGANGTLVLQAPDYSLGQTTVNGGILQLAGGNQTLFVPFQVPASPGNQGNATTNGQVVQVNYGATLDLDGTNQSVQDLTTANTLDLMGGTVTNTSSTPSVLHISTNGSFTWSGNITGNIDFVRDNGSTYTINSPQTYTGTTTLAGGLTTLLDLGTLQNTSQIDIAHSSLRWDNTGLEALSNRLTNASTGALIPIYLDGGGFDFSGRNGLNDVANIGAVTLDSGANLIQVGSTGGSAQLNITSLTRNVGSTITFTAGIGGASTNNGALGQNPYIYFTNAPTLTNGMIGGWAVTVGEDLGAGGTTTQASFATYDSATGIIGLSTYNQVGVGNAGNTFGAGDNTQIRAAQTLPVGGAVTNSLTVDGAGFTLSFASPTDTLTLQSGGLLNGTDGNARTIGASQGSGNITTAAGQQELFIHSGTGTTFTVNSNLINNGAPVNLVLDGLNIPGAAVTLAGNNTYTGTTYVDGVISYWNSANNGGTGIPGNVIVSASTNNGSDAEPPGDASVVFLANNQTAATSNVTLLGNTQLNLNGYNGTIASLTFTNSGDAYSNDGPELLTLGTGGVGTLTITGTLSASTVGISNPNNLANVAQTDTTPVINGFVNLANASPTIYVDPTNVPGQIGLELNAALTTSATMINKTGSGVLGIGGQEPNSFTAGINVTAGTLAFGANNVSFPNSTVVLASGTVLDTRALTGLIGSVSGSGTIENYSLNTGGTLQLGTDNTNTTFSGQFYSPFAQGLLSVTKYGTGTMSLTGDSSYAGTNNNGTLTVDAGGVSVGGSSGILGFNTTTLNSGGTLTLDDSASAVNNRLGGTTEYLSPGVTGTVFRTLNFQGGALTVNGNASTAVAEALGNVNLTGGGTLNLNAAGTGGINVSIQSLAGQGQYTSLFLAGPNLGTAAGPGVAAVTINAGGNYGTPTNPAGADGTTTMTVRPDILADNTTTGNIGFLLKDPTTGLLRPLLPSELYPTIAGAANSTNTNYGLTTPQAITATQTINTLTLNSATATGGTGGLTAALVGTNPWGVDGNLISVKVQDGGILAFAGNTGLTAGAYTYGSATYDVHVMPGATLNFNAVLNQSSGFVKADGGTLVLQQPYFTNNAAGGSGTSSVQEFAVNGGTVQLAGNSSVGVSIVPTIWTSPTLAAPDTMNLTVNNGSVDLDGGSELVNYINTQNPAPYGGGTAANPLNIITNTGAAPVNLITAYPTSSTVSTTSSAEINNTGGALSFYHQGGTATSVMTLTSPSDYTGATYQEGSTLTLINSGALTGTSSININGATLVLDNTGQSDSTTRIPAAAPIFMNGGTFQVNARQIAENENIGTVNPISGQNVLYINQDNGNSQTGSYSLTLANLVNTPASNSSVPSGGIVSFQGTTTATTVGATGGNPRFFLSQVNGSSTITTNGIIGPWAIANANNTGSALGFATYSTTYGVGYLGEANFTGYSADALTAGVATDNINTTASTYGVTARTINTLSSISPAAATQIALNSLTDTLTLGAGGLLIDDSGNHGVTIGSGQLTASNNSMTGNALYVFQQVNTATINTPIIDNGSGSMALVKSGAGTLVLNPLAQVDASVVTSGSASITVTSSNGLFTGEQVSGTGIPSGTSISTISGTTVTLSQNATATGANVMLTLTPNTPVNNTYGGTTIVNAGTLSLPGTAIAVPGNLVLNNGATVTQTSVGSIAPTSNVTINGVATLTLATNGGTTLNSITFNDNGNSGTPTLAVPSSGLTLTGNNPITSNSDNTAAAPTISGNNITLTGSAPVITVNPITSAGQFAESLQISSSIYAYNNVTITGTGTLVLNNSNGLNTVNWNSGTVVLGNNNGFGGGTLNINGAVGLMGYTTTSPGFSLYNQVNLNGPGASLTFVGESNNATGGYDQITLGGNVNLAGNPTIAVSSAILTDTLSGSISSSDSLGFTKSGPGTLVLSGSNSFTGQVTIQQGMLTLSNSSAIPSNNPVTIGSTAALNINGNNVNIATLADGAGGSGGVLTNGSTTTAAVLTIGPTDGSTPTTSFSGAIVNDTASHALSVVKIGGSTQAFAGPNTYAGGTTINAGVLLANTPIVLGSSTGSGTVVVANGGALAGGSAAIPGNIATGASTNAVNVNSGAVISAGNGIAASNTTGFLNTTGGATAGYTQVWNGGASYNWKLNTASPTTTMTPATTTTPGTTDPGGAGANWDMLSMQTLNLVNSGGTFTVNVIPLSSSATFNPNQTYQWTIADVKNANGIYLNGSNSAATLGTNFANLLSSMTLNVPSSMTTNATAPFNLGVVPDGNTGEDIIVSYAGAPEPTSLMLLGLGAGGMMLRRRRRRKPEQSN